MNIIPISSLPHRTPPTGTAAKAPSSDFKGLFDKLMSEINETNTQKAQDAVGLATGDIDDIASMTANSLKAEVALQMLVQTRNRLLEGYQEIMRLNV